MATASPRAITVDEFLAIEWDDSEVKAELDNGVIRMMGGGTLAHGRVQRNILVALDLALRGTGCSPQGPDIGIITSTTALRCPDVSVFRGRLEQTDDALRALDDPRLVAEVLSPRTRQKDLTTKLAEYRALPSLDHILFVDPEVETVRLLTRTGPRGWNDEDIEPGQDVILSRLPVRLTWSDIFARR